MPLARFIPLNMNNSNAATECSSYQIWQAQRKEVGKTDKMTKIAVIGDIFSRVSFPPYSCRCAISRQVWLGTRPESILGKTQFCLFFFPLLARFVPFSYVSIAKDIRKPHRVKKQFPTS